MADSTQRNIGILAHIDAGKTTLTENLLHLAGSLRYPGAVEHGTTVTDWQLQEQERGITIGAAAVTFDLDGRQVTLVDTPGHVDFTVEVARALRALDGAILVISGPDGVQAQTETVWMQATEHAIPAIGFLNKLDRPGYDEESVLEEIEGRLGITPAPLSRARLVGDSLRIHHFLTDELHVWGLEGLSRNQRSTMTIGTPDDDEQLHREIGLEVLADAIAAHDDGFAEAVLEGRPPDLAQWHAAIRRATIARGCLPILHGVARFGVGVGEVASAVGAYLPGPTDVPLPKMVDATDGTPAERPARHGDRDPLGFVFKTERRRKGQRLAFVRVYAGGVCVGDHLIARRADTAVEVAALYRLFAGDAVPVDSLAAGEIGAIEVVDGADPLRTGDTLAGVPQGPIFESLAIPQPVIATALEADDAETHEQLEAALEDLITHDPSLAVGRDPESGQLTVAGMGELHLALAVERLQREWGLSVQAGSPKVHRRHQLIGSGVGEHVIQQERYGTGQILVRVRVEPASDVSDAWLVSDSAVLKRDDWTSALEGGLFAACGGGSPGYDLIGVRARVLAIEVRGSDLTPVAFRDAGFRAGVHAIAEAGAIEVEPWCRLRVIVPEDMVGRVVSDLARRRARIGTSEATGTTQLLHAEGPLSEFIGYATGLRSSTAGRGVFSLELSGWEPVETQ